MQLETTNNGQLIAYTGIYLAPGLLAPLSPVTARAVVKSFAVEIARFANWEPSDLLAPESERESNAVANLRGALDLARAEKDRAVAERDDARGARDVLSAECGTLGRERDKARAERDRARKGYAAANARTTCANQACDDARTRLNAMTADRDFVTVQRDTARAMTCEVAALDTVPRHAWDGLMTNARALRAALCETLRASDVPTPVAFRAEIIIARTDCLTDTDRGTK